MKYFLNTYLIAALLGTAFISLTVGCSKDDDDPSNATVGADFGGGIVAYIFQEGDPGFVEGEIHGIVVSKTHQASSQFGCRGTAVGGTLQSVGSGRSNTTAIVAFHDAMTNYAGNPGQCNQWNNGTVAAKVCDDLELNGHSDWYLPSIGELQLMYDNLHLNGNGNFSSDGSAQNNYISSSESGSDFAYMFSFNDGSVEIIGKSLTPPGRVRAVRSF